MSGRIADTMNALDWLWSNNFFVYLSASLPNISQFKSLGVKPSIGKFYVVKKYGTADLEALKLLTIRSGIEHWEWRSWEVGVPVSQNDLWHVFTEKRPPAAATATAKATAGAAVNPSGFVRGETAPSSHFNLGGGGSGGAKLLWKVNLFLPSPLSSCLPNPARRSPPVFLPFRPPFNSVKTGTKYSFFPPSPREPCEKTAGCIFLVFTSLPLLLLSSSFSFLFFFLASTFFFPLLRPTQCYSYFPLPSVQSWLKFMHVKLCMTKDALAGNHTHRIFDQPWRFLISQSLKSQGTHDPGFKSAGSKIWLKYLIQDISMQ